MFDMTGLSKAEMLEFLRDKKFPVPRLHYFAVSEWNMNPAEVLRNLQNWAEGKSLAVRSSSRAEDSEDGSHAGEFDSVLNVPGNDRQALHQAIQKVRKGLHSANDQIIAQEMVGHVHMSGVLTTHSLFDGSPYYVVNYDDVSGETDLVTSGKGTGKTVHVYRGVREEYFDSSRLKRVILLAQELEKQFPDVPLDIEFAVDKRLEIHLLQVRRICTAKHWDPRNHRDVNVHIAHVAEFVANSLAPRQGLYGQHTVLGVMTDWNPAEMIGIAPRPLAVSLYRELITRRVWSLAREEMGYRKMPPVELMLSIGGKPYIDIRASFNSFLPDGLSPLIAERLVNAWILRLNENPGLHDKVEFSVVHTIADPDFRNDFQERYPGLLSSMELVESHPRLLRLTRNALYQGSTLAWANEQIRLLEQRQWRDLEVERQSSGEMTLFNIVACLSGAVEECRHSGTLPFAIIARHAFIAEALLRTMARMEAISPDRVAEFKRGVKTISGDLTRDFAGVLRGNTPKQAFLERYGHLRPGTYDILSPSYRERHDLFSSASVLEVPARAEAPFALAAHERKRMDSVLADGGLELDAERFLQYAAAAIAGREYAKFVFTRHVSHMLDLLAVWGEKLSLNKDELSMLPITDVLDSLHKPLPLAGTEYFRRRIDINREEYRLGRSFELAYLIRSERDVYIVPQHRSAPNFITRKRLTAEVIYLDARASSHVDLHGKIVCIESADPGYDWIFTRGIAGLITRYGGANSHMSIRCAEYDLPAAIGCGELIFEKICASPACLLDCGARAVSPVNRIPSME